MLTYISYGKKIFRKKEGIAADFCPICRQGSPVEVLQIRSQSHVNHIGFGQGDLVGRLCRCTQCGSEWALRSGTISTVVHPTVPVSVETLIAETYPRFREVNAERLQHEATIRRNPRELDRETRLALIAEPFYVMDNTIEQESKAFDQANFLGGLGCLGAIGLGLAGLLGFFISGPLWGFGLLIAAVGIGWGALKLSAANGRRFMREKIYPRLALALAPLAPNDDELSQIVAAIGSGGNPSKAAKRMDLTVFSPMLEEVRARTRAAV